MIEWLMLALLQPSRAVIQNRTLQLDGVGTVTYGISVPSDYTTAHPRPLILALHPGGPRSAYYGSLFARQIVLPGLANLKAIVVAPDCAAPASGWDDPACERAAMAVVTRTLEAYSIDRQRVLVTGFSMGGRGTWFMARRHADLFTAAIAMAAPTVKEAIDELATIPTYVIHSRDDEVVPFGPAELNARTLQERGRAVKFEALQGVGHFQMGGYLEALGRAGAWVVNKWSDQEVREKDRR